MRALPARSKQLRHLRKYATGKLGEDASFWFRGPDGKLNLRAQNLIRFVEIAEGVDGATWDFHRERGDYSRWIKEAIKDSDLAKEVAAIETSGADRDAARAAIRDAIERRYTLPA